MAVQTTYNERISRARAGHVESTEFKNVISRNVETAAIGFGKPVVQGVADYGVRNSATNDTTILGIATREYAQDPTSVDAYPVYASAAIMTKGLIWVTVGAAVVAGDPVHVIVNGGTYGKTGGVAIPNARFETSAASGALALVRLA